VELDGRLDIGLRLLTLDANDYAIASAEEILRLR
jgi:hypothetical protein